MKQDSLKGALSPSFLKAVNNPTTPMSQPLLTDIKLLQKEKVLELSFANGETFSLPCEYLRVFSPSAEVCGQHGNPKILVTNKKYINIFALEPIGNYAVKIVFDDGHATGLYSWETLYELAIHYEKNWQHYLERLQEAGANRA